MSEKIDKAWIDVARDLGRQDREGECQYLRGEIERLRADMDQRMKAYVEYQERDEAEIEQLRVDRTALVEHSCKVERERDELLAALVEIERVGDQKRIGGGQHCAALARAAIAKAEGGK
jgi:hypothetical protein